MEVETMNKTYRASIRSIKDIELLRKMSALKLEYRQISSDFTKKQPEFIRKQLECIERTLEWFLNQYKLFLKQSDLIKEQPMVDTKVLENMIARKKEHMLNTFSEFVSMYNDILSDLSKLGIDVKKKTVEHILKFQELTQTSPERNPAMNILSTDEEEMLDERLQSEEDFHNTISELHSGNMKVETCIRDSYILSKHFSVPSKSDKLESKKQDYPTESIHINKFDKEKNQNELKFSEIELVKTKGNPSIQPKEYTEEKTNMKSLHENSNEKTQAIVKEKNDNLETCEIPENLHDKVMKISLDNIEKKPNFCPQISETRVKYGKQKNEVELFHHLTPKRMKRSAFKAIPVSKYYKIMNETGGKEENPITWEDHEKFVVENMLENGDEETSLSLKEQNRILTQILRRKFKAMNECREYISSLEKL